MAVPRERMDSDLGRFVENKEVENETPLAIVRRKTCLGSEFRCVLVSSAMGGEQLGLGRFSVRVQNDNGIMNRVP